MAYSKETSAYILRTAKQTFNKAWRFLDKKRLNKSEQMQLLELVHTSYYLWKQVPHCTATNISISLWQISRAYAHIGEGKIALLYAEGNIRHCKKEKTDGFYTAYAHESAARAYVILNEKLKASTHLLKARKFIQTTKETETNFFFKDLVELDKFLQE